MYISFIYIHRFLKSKHDIKKNEKRDDTGRCDVMQLLDNSQLFLHVIFKRLYSAVCRTLVFRIYINKEPSIFVDVGLNPVNTVFCCCLFSSFFLEFFFTLSF